MRTSLRVLLAVVSLSVVLVGCGQDPACPDVCADQYDVCVSSGGSTDVCAHDRQVCENMCSGRAMTFPDAGPSAP